MEVVALAAAVAAWVLLLVEGIVLFAILRQIGVLHDRIRPRGVFELSDEGPKVGTVPPTMQIQGDDGRRSEIAVAGGRSSGLLFVSPGCALCKTVLTVFPAFSRGLGAELDLMVIVRGDPPDAEQYRRAYRLPPSVVVAPGMRVFELYGVGHTPYFMVLDRNARLRSAGLVNSLEQLEIAVEALVEPAALGDARPLPVEVKV